MRVRVGLVAAFVLALAPASAPALDPICGPLPCQAPQAIVTATSDDLAHFSGAQLAFDYPASWQTYQTPYRGLHWAPIVYLSSQALREPCVATPTSLSCGSALAGPLEENGIYAIWQQIMMPLLGRPGFRQKIPRRNTIVVDGIRVPVRREFPGSCASLGGDESFAVSFPRKWIYFAACLRGPNLRQAERQILEMLALTTFISR